DVLLAAPTPDGSWRGSVAEVRRAGDRAASLTAQLLAFSRRQVLQPVVLDLNALLQRSSDLLKRLIGDRVRLELRLGPGLRPVKADPVQIDQVLLNLAANARDAMPHGGRLTLETANVDLDGSSVRGWPELKPGPHVLLALSDTGEGMAPEVKARL